MASAKQIAWRKKFARMRKAGKFKKAKSKSKQKKSYDTLVAQKGTSLKNTIEFWEQAERDSIEAGHDAEGGKQKAYFENQAEIIHSMLKDFKKSLP